MGSLSGYALSLISDSSHSARASNETAPPAIVPELDAEKLKALPRGEQACLVLVELDFQLALSALSRAA